MAESKYDPSKGFNALNRDRSEDAPEETSAEKRARHAVELDGARASLEQVAGVFPHVGKGGQASADLEDAARNFARLASRDDDEADGREADAKEAEDQAKKDAKAADKAAKKARDEDDDDSDDSEFATAKGKKSLSHDTEVANPMTALRSRPQRSDSPAQEKEENPNSDTSGTRNADVQLADHKDNRAHEEVETRSDFLDKANQEDEGDETRRDNADQLAARKNARRDNNSNLREANRKEANVSAAVNFAANREAKRADK